MNKHATQFGSASVDGTHQVSQQQKQGPGIRPSSSILPSWWNDWLPGSLFVEGILLLSIIVNGMGAGIMMIFSNTIMPSLATLSDYEGIQVMTTINIQIVNPTFIFVFFGGILTIIPACKLWRQSDLFSMPARYYAIATFLLHFFGIVVVTVTQNVPRNDELDRLWNKSLEAYGGENNGGVVTEEASDFWRNEYLTKWVAWNTARAIFGILAAMTGALSLRAIGIGVGSSMIRNDGDGLHYNN